MAPKTTLNPPTFRYPFASEISDQPIGVQNAHRAAFQGIQDLQQAVTALNSKMTTSTTTSTAATTTVTENFSQTVIAASTIIGTVNNQTGVTAYSTLQSDYGAFLIFNDASPVAVTLSTLSTSPAIALPWFASFINSGTGTVTLTPATGLIEGGATFQIHASNAITVVFDGTNFYVEAPGAQPQNTPAVTHEWLNSFSSITGTFGQSQPAASDLTNGTTGTGAVVLETTPTITNPAITGGSINNTPIGQTTPAAGTFTSLESTTSIIQGGGMKHQRFALNPTASGQGASADTAVTWATPFADANYTVVAMLEYTGTGNVQGSLGIYNKTAVGFTIRMTNVGTGNNAGDADCIAMHD